MCSSAFLCAERRGAMGGVETGTHLIDFIDTTCKLH